MDMVCIITLSFVTHLIEEACNDSEATMIVTKGIGHCILSVQLWTLINNLSRLSCSCKQLCSSSYSTVMHCQVTETERYIDFEATAVIISRIVSLSLIVIIIITLTVNFASHFSLVSSF